MWAFLCYLNLDLAVGLLVLFGLWTWTCDVALDPGSVSDNGSGHRIWALDLVWIFFWALGVDCFFY